jgi:hypothetical protein
VPIPQSNMQSCHVMCQWRPMSKNILFDALLPPANVIRHPEDMCVFMNICRFSAKILPLGTRPARQLIRDTRSRSALGLGYTPRGSILPEAEKGSKVMSCLAASPGTFWWAHPGGLAGRQHCGWRWRYGFTRVALGGRRGGQLCSFRPSGRNWRC